MKRRVKWLAVCVLAILLCTGFDLNTSSPQVAFVGWRNGTTALAPNYSSSHITSKTTTTITSSTAYVQSIVINVSGAGSSQTLTIQDKEATPKILYSTTIAVGNSQPITLQAPVVMTSGIDIVTAGTTAGTQDVFVTYWQ